MDKIGRNDKCHCGSGKKYKRCCINKEKIPPHPFSSYPCAELLKILSLLMLQPRNHGKNIRLEIAILNALKYSRNTSQSLNLTNIRKEIIRNVTPSVHEDPPEEFFTELLYVESGNHIVFPGIAANGVEIVQQLLNTFRLQSKLPQSFTSAVVPVVNLILFIHTRIAITLGYSERMFEDEHHEPLFIPGDPEIFKYKDLFSISKEDLSKLLQDRQLSIESFNKLVLEIHQSVLEFNDIDDSPLLQKPFILFENEYVLANPTAELFCLNDFILSSATEHSCLDTLLRSYHEVGINELFPVFLKMSWKPLKFRFPDDATVLKSSIYSEFLFKIDTNCLAYVTMITEKDIWNKDLVQKVKDHSKEIKTRVETVGLLLKEKFKDHQILFIHVIHKSRILSKAGLKLDLLQNVDFSLFFSYEEMILLPQNWKFDNLTLWKYGKFLHLFEDNHKFAPYNTHLSKMKWYMDNDESFYHSDRETPNAFLFEFEIESDVRRSGIERIDKRAVGFFQNTKTTFIPCYRKDEHFPVYISQDVNQGYLSSCLLEYKSPIWCVSAREKDPNADVYINGILFWLHEMFQYAKTWLNEFGNVALLFRITLDPQFYDNQRSISTGDAEVKFRYKITASQRLIDIYIPIELHNYLYSENNYGEQLLMQVVIRSLNELKQELKAGALLQDEQIENILGTIMNFPRKKFINVLSNYRDLTIIDTDIPLPRVIPKAEISSILQNQIHELRQIFTIPETFDNRENQNLLFRQLVTFHIQKVKSYVSKYNETQLLIFLMRRQESILQKNAYQRVTYPVKQACYGKYFNVFEEFTQSMKDNNLTNLALRVLIEWVACWSPSGNKVPSDDEVDLMLAHVSEVINYGSLSDEIKYGLREVQMMLLPSGRLGIDRELRQNLFDKFHDNLFGAEFESLSENYHEHYENNGAATQERNHKTKLDKFEQTFKSEWGIGIHDIFVLTYEVVQCIFDQGKSVLIISKEEFHKLLANSKFSIQEIDSWIKILNFIKRDDVLSVPTGFDKEEIFPWRYNRRISYLMKPIITIIEDDIEKMILSARHLYKSSENLVSKFHDGTLPLDKESKTLRGILAEMNAIKGKEFRNEVQRWLAGKTNISVFPQEITIKKKGFFIADDDKGDIDILAIDHNNKIIYSIECKNTNQSKVAYDFQREILNYTGRPGKPGLIQKHVNRDTWLRNNLQQVYEKLSVNHEYKLSSIVVSKNVLPTAFLGEIEIPILSVHALKKNGLPV